MIKEIEKWWDKTSKKYQKENIIDVKSAHYGPYSPDENELRLLGNVKGKKILEIGCGGGQCSIAFAKQGAKCIAIDISKEQLKYAIKLAKKNKVDVKFIKWNVQTLNPIKSDSQDIVFSAFALQYVPNLTKCFKEVYRILKKNGLFVFSLDHPFSSIIYEKINYYKTGKRENRWGGLRYVIYHRKISDIINSLINAKFKIEKIIEPLVPNKKDPWKKLYSTKLIKIIGPTIIFKTRKI